jgi:signal transduction histidine kinase
MRQITPAADRAAPATPNGPSRAVHETTLERALGRIFAMFIALIVLVFWFGSAMLAGQRPGSVAADVLLSVLLIWQAAQALHRPPSQRDLFVQVIAIGSLLLASRSLAAPGSPFLADTAYMPMVPVAAAWAVWSASFVAPVPVLLVMLATGAWHLGGDLPVEQASAALTTVACTSWAVRLLRARARRADADADALFRQMAAQDAALAAEEAERRAANAVHDDVLSVLRAVIVADRQVPWNLVVSKALRARDSLARQVLRSGHDSADLGSALRRIAESVAELDVRCDIDDDLDVPVSTVEALGAALGEGLRNVAAHAKVRGAVVTGRRSRSGGVIVTVSDDGIGFDPARVGPASTGLRNSIRARLSDAGGHAGILSAPGQGTSLVLTWNPPQPASTPAADPLDLARRMAPSPQLIFAGFMLPVLLSGLFWLCLRWHDMRWQGTAAAVTGGALVLAILCSRYLSQVRIPHYQAVGLVAANTTLAAVGSLAVAPGSTDAFVYWIAGTSGIVIATVYFIRGPVFGLVSLGLDVAALTVGLVVTGSGIAASGWVSVLTSPAIGAGLAAAMLAAFRSLSSHTESQLAAYRERLRWQARAEAVSRVDNTALENARRLAGPVLDAVVSSPAPNPDLRTAAALANATLRDELLAPGFLTAALGDQVRAARSIGARITVDFARQSDAALIQTARTLLAAALADLDVGDDVTLQVHPSAGQHPALLIVHARSRQSDHAALRKHAGECGALISDLDDSELLIRFMAAQERAAVAPL